MYSLLSLWNDEVGFVLSAEAVLVGTVGVFGAVVGLNMVSRAVHEEFNDVAFAIRSLDQSYSFEGISGAGAWRAGSTFIQQDVETSLEELRRPAEPPAEPPQDDPAAPPPEAE